MNCPECGKRMVCDGKAKLLVRLWRSKKYHGIVRRYTCKNSECLTVAYEKIVEM